MKFSIRLLLEILRGNNSLMELQVNYKIWFSFTWFRVLKDKNLNGIEIDNYFQYIIKYHHHWWFIRKRYFLYYVKLINFVRERLGYLLLSLVVPIMVMLWRWVNVLLEPGIGSLPVFHWNMSNWKFSKTN